ncbi:hypothetical protein SAMN05216262_1228 [Colwellia chukchiensis]|uniref:Outer membrane protein beta-barrel domain-containing protein n=1 Tax=Colwellia chukchiensis TaxID=641665 RepID=A0A1H7SZW7_9GAMM|nr:hypothetical protein [Colwellia chukchiensis]SEL78202.1 hypothetical protein SAMN05216262_1228 [Colwellia chukchiensis]
MKNSIKFCMISLLLTSFSSFSAQDDDYKIGLSVGSPALANIVIHKEIKGLKFQLSGGYWGDKVSGIEVGTSFYNNPDNFISNANIVLGYSRQENSKLKEWSYAGITTRLEKNGFFIEPGLSFGSGDYSSPQLLIQAGYLW